MAFHEAAGEGHLPIVEVFIELELSPFFMTEVSNGCCVSMTVVFVDRMV